MKFKKIVAPFLTVFISLSYVPVAFAQWDRGMNAAGPGQTNLPGGTITGIITNVMLWLLGLVGIIGVIGFVIAGIWYLTAAGDDSKMEMGKNAMTWSIIGVIVALMGYVIIQAVDAMLQGGAGNTAF